MRSHARGRNPVNVPRVAARLALPVTADDHAQGSVVAEVTLLQYGDYECPYTRMSRHAIHALQREYPDKLRFVFRHFPLDEIHPHARPAAEAAEAAAAQGDFWTMHDYLFEHQQALEETDLHQYAIDLGLEPDRFDRDRTSAEVTQRINRDRQSGERSGVPGTPTFFVNGVRHDAPFDVDSLRSAIMAQLQGGPGGNVTVTS
jgi:protein-disulfide isomerase